MATVTVRVPEKLKEKMKKYSIEAGEVARRAWDEEIKKRELDEAREAAAELGEFFARLPKGQVVKWIREDRERR
jgi:hypothetical protein